MSLILSPERMTFDYHEKVKHVKITNTTTKNGQTKPIMFKIKTNKIQLVDAKPSCGYISGKPGQNEINVAIRWLNNTNDHSAKLQILYVENPRITEQVVEKNSKLFDNDQYNQNYQAIKRQSQADVKTTLLPVTRKPKVQPNPNPHVIDLTNPEPKPDPPIVIPNPPKPPVNQPQLQLVSLTKCIFFVFFAFLIGLLAGFTLGQGQLNQVNFTSFEQIMKSELFEKISGMINSQTVQQVQNSEIIQESVTVTAEEVRVESEKFEDISEFTSEQESPITGAPSEEDPQFGVDQESHLGFTTEQKQAEASRPTEENL